MRIDISSHVFAQAPIPNERDRDIFPLRIGCSFIVVATNFSYYKFQIDGFVCLYLLNTVNADQIKINSSSIRNEVRHRTDLASGARLLFIINCKRTARSSQSIA